MVSALYHGTDRKKFCTAVGLPDVVTRTRMGGDRFSHLCVVKDKVIHTRYRALGPELIPVYRQSARRSL